MRLDKYLKVSRIIKRRTVAKEACDGGRVTIPLIVNAINSGTSFMHKQPFIRKAARGGGTKAMGVMKAFIEDAFEKMTK